VRQPVPYCPRKSFGFQVCVFTMFEAVFCTLIIAERQENIAYVYNSSVSVILLQPGSITLIRHVSENQLVIRGSRGGTNLHDSLADGLNPLHFFFILGMV
jgi:hypothetical protein